MARAADIWERLRWQVQFRWWLVQSRAAAVAAVIAAAALIAATLYVPSWTLRFERVLAWPVLVLIVLVMFRRSVTGLLEGTILRRFNLGPGGLSGELEQREEPFDPAQLPDVAPTGADLQHDYALLMLANLAQSYQVQINFLKHLTHASDGLTYEATLEWFGRELQKQPVTHGWAAQPLVDWLVDRSLLTVTEDGGYRLGPAAADFISVADTIWYAPKAA